jgi:hypothetical protein
MSCITLATAKQFLCKAKRLVANKGLFLVRVVLSSGVLFFAAVTLYASTLGKNASPP